MAISLLLQSADAGSNPGSRITFFQSQKSILKNLLWTGHTVCYFAITQRSSSKVYPEHSVYCPSHYELVIYLRSVCVFVFVCVPCIGKIIIISSITLGFWIIAYKSRIKKLTKTITLPFFNPYCVTKNIFIEFYPLFYACSIQCFCNHDGSGQNDIILSKV